MPLPPSHASGGLPLGARSQIPGLERRNWVQAAAYSDMDEEIPLYLELLRPLDFIAHIDDAYTIPLSQGQGGIDSCSIATEGRYDLSTGSPVDCVTPVPHSRV